MNIEIIERKGAWQVQFSYGNQKFTLDFKGNKRDCQFIANQLNHCFSKFKDNIKIKGD